MNVETLAWPMLLAILSRHDCRLRRECVGERASPAAFLRIAGGIAFAGTFFLGPGLLLGITSALRQGGGALISFIVLFGAVNALGAVAGPALLGSYMDWQIAAGVAEQAARSDTMRLVAVIGLATTLYLVLLRLLRVRRLRTDVSAGAASKDEASAAGSGWTQPRVVPSIGAIMAALTIWGFMLILSAFGRA